MKKIILPLLFLPAFFSPFFAQNSQRCGYDELLQLHRERFPALDSKIKEMEESTQNRIRQIESGADAREVITIPVVVHVVYKNDEENISDLLIQSQIDVINEDFRMQNSNAPSVPDEFKSLTADVEVEFCLASLNPQGLPATGITRTKTDIDCIANIYEVKENNKPRLFYNQLGGANAWDTESYLNIWVANSCGAVLGVTPSLAFSVLVPEEDGVVVDYNYFGNNCASAPSSPYNLGRTTTHEIGHYLNLLHIWSGCDEMVGDFVDDTPLQEEPYYGCPSHPQNSCGSNDLFMNFMDYTDDRCMSMFSKGQKMRMLATLGGPRKGLKESVGCAWLTPELPFDDQAIVIYPNPARQCIHIDFNASIEGEVILELKDVSGKLIFRDVESGRSFRSIDATALSNGIYFLTFEAGERIITKKVLIAN